MEYEAIIMKKILIFLMIMFLLITSVYAQKTVKTLENEIEYDKRFRPNENQQNHTILIQAPDGIASIQNFVVLVKGDFTTPITTFELNFSTANGNQKTCSPATVTSPDVAVYGYEMRFDCSSRAENWAEKNKVNITLHLSVDNDVWERYLSYRMTYYNNPVGEYDLFGTEYEIYEDGTIFLQLRDNEGIPVDDGDCHLDIYYPNTANTSHEPWIINAPMVYKDGSDGIYYYDINLGNITGVYMMAATCAYTFSGIWAYTEDSMESLAYQPITGSHFGNTHNLISHEDFLYMQCTSAGGAQKNCEAYYHFNLSIINTSNMTNINLYYSGEASTTALLTLYAYNWTSGTWITLDNTLTYSGASPSSNPIGINDFVSNNVPITDVISPVNDTILIRLMSASGAVYTQFNNWLNMKILTAEGVVYDLKGGGEIHVSDSMTQIGWLILDEFDGVPGEVWNHTPSRNLTYYPDANYTEIGNYVWNRTTRNLTYYPNNTDATIEGVWDYNNRTLTNVSNIATDIWNWQGTSSILTQLIVNIWSYIGRYTHGIIS